MSCYACADVIDCVEFGGIISDVSPSNGFFATQDYSFLVDCPAGYVCFPGIFPIIITIHKGDIPGVTITAGGTMSLLGCMSLLSVTIPIGASSFQIQGLANGLFQQWAFQQAQCLAKNTIPPPVFIGGRHVRTELTNTEQCFTAHCTPADAGPPSQQCVEPGQYNLTLFDASADQITAAQDQLNANALKEATDSANALLLCGVCNAFLHDFQACAGDPGKVTSVTIPAGKYCLPKGTPQAQVDALANNDLVKQLHDQLVGLGCICPGPTINGSLQVSNVCTCTYRWFVNGIFMVPDGTVMIGTNFDAPSQYTGDGHGAWPPGGIFPAVSRLDPQNCPGPSITSYYTS